jgi:hypothetical protein
MDLDLDALLAPPRWNAQRCTVAQAIQEIEDAAAREKVSAACDNPDVPGKNIATAIRGLIGETPSPATIKRHQTRKENTNPCTCP